MPSNTRVLLAMGAIVALIIVGLIQLQQIQASIIVHLGQASLAKIMTGPLPRNEWRLAAINLLLVSAFLLLVPLRLKGPWEAHGAYLGFAVSMFSEMYGFPLTVYFLSAAGYPYFEPQFVGYVFAYGQLLGSPVVVVGLFLLYKGWKEIFFRRADALVTVGIYRTVRHPQYLGLLMVTLGHLLVWPTIPTAIMWPFLLGLYYRQARKEDKDLLRKFGEQFIEYSRKTPMFVPRIDPLRKFRTA